MREIKETRSSGTARG